MTTVSNFSFTKTSSRRNYLQMVADGESKAPKLWTPDRLPRLEIGRLRKMCLIAHVAREVPRRIGYGATSDELARDKFLSKQIGSALYLIWYNATLAPTAFLQPDEIDESERYLLPPLRKQSRQLAVQGFVNEELRRLGRTIHWDNWWDEVKPKLERRRQFLAAWAIGRDQVALGWRMVKSVETEIHWVDLKFAKAADKYECSPAVQTVRDSHAA